MLGLLTGVAQDGRTTTELTRADVPLAVIDRDGSPVSAGLTAFMEANGEAVALEDRAAPCRTPSPRTGSS